MFDLFGADAVLRERELEPALIEHIERFLLELGQGFAFVGKQVLLEIGNQECCADCSSTI